MARSQPQPPETESPPSPTERSPRQPEKRIGPFAGGVGVAVWLNQAESSDGGTRTFRSVSLAPRRYFDKQSNQWKDAPSYNPTDLPALIFALQEAQTFCFTTPLPNGELEDPDQPPY